MRRRIEEPIRLDVKRAYEKFGCIVYNFSQARASKQTPGIPDLRVVHRKKGVSWWHEVKSPTGTQTPEQIEFEIECELCGETYRLGGVDEALAQLRAIGVLAG